MNKTILTGIIVVLVVVIGVVAFTGSNGNDSTANSATTTAQVAQQQATSTNQNTSLSSTYTSNEFGFQFDYPDNWRVGNADISSGTFQIFNYSQAEAGAGSQFRDGQSKIEIAVTDRSRPATSSVYTEQSREEREVAIDGVTSVRTESTLTGGSQTLSYTIPLSETSSKFLSMTAYGDAQKFDVLRRMVETFSFVGSDNGSDQQNDDTAVSNTVPPSESSNWSVEGGVAYRNGRAIEDLDAASVRLYPSTYAVDKNGVWVSSGYAGEFEKLPTDAANFRYLADGYGADSENVYYYGRTIEQATPDSFELLGENCIGASAQCANPYAVDANNVFYEGELLASANPDTFTRLEGNYAKDNTNIYFNGQLIEGADTSTFTVLEDNMRWAKDVNNIYQGSTKLGLGLDPETFRFAGGALVDANSVFMQNGRGGEYVELSQADPATFEVVGVCAQAELSSSSYYKDEDSVYTGTEIAEDIDADSFAYLGAYTPRGAEVPGEFAFAKDASAVYQGCANVLSEADPASFQTLDAGYAKDSENVWLFDNQLPEANADSFEVVSTGDDYSQPAYGKDDQNVWEGTRIQEGVNPADCTVSTIAQCASSQ